MTKVLSLNQPYAALIFATDPATGRPLKRHETRGGPLNGDMRPAGVRGIPGLSVNRGERIGIAATARWAPGWCRWYDPGYSDEDADALNTLDSLGVSTFEDIDGLGQWRLHPRWAGLPLGVMLGTVEVVDCIPITDCADHTHHICLSGGGLLHHSSPHAPHAEGQTERDISDQLPFGDWEPGRWAIELTDPVKFADPIPVKGRQGVWSWDGAS